MDRHNLARIHIQKIRQNPVTQIRSCDGKVGHCPIHFPHLECPAAIERKGSRRNEIFHGQAGGHKPFPVKMELVIIPHVEHIMHQMQPVSAVQYFS